MSLVVYGWGNAKHGQLSVGTDRDIITSPKEIKCLEDKQIKQISCGLSHTLIVKNDGQLFSCGSNEYGQLGHKKSEFTAEHVDILRNMCVTHVCAGVSFSLALTTAGEVFSWGDNSAGQLGRNANEPDLHSKPKLIKVLAMHTVVQIACGSYHCLALTDDDRVFSWGGNRYGQLGLGIIASYCDTPTQIACLRGIPIAQIIAGGYHSFILSWSRAVFGWGKNCFGQLGVNDEQDRPLPTLCKSLRNQKVQYICCGEDHTSALTQDGGLFTFGAGSSGQLGHNMTQNEILPKRVIELMGSVVTQIACGRRHTIAFVPASGRLYTFGLGGCGQLGLGNTANHNTPCHIPTPFIVGMKVRISQEMDHDAPQFIVKRISSGGDHCFVQLSNAKNAGESDDHRELDPATQITHLTADKCDDVQKLQAGQTPTIELADDIMKIFSSSGCLNATCLLPNEEHFGCSSKKHGVEMDEVRQLMSRIHETRNISIIQKITESIAAHLLPSLPPSPPDVEALRVYLILPEFHQFDEPKNFSSLIIPFGNCIVNLDRAASRVLDLWWGSLKSRHFRKVVSIFKQTIVYILQLPTATSDQTMEMANRFSGIKISLEVLKKLNTINEKNGQIIPYHHFYVPELRDKVNIKADYVGWVHQTRVFPTPALSFCNYPFVFDGAAKSMLLQTDAYMQMQSAFEEVQRRNIQSLFLPIDPVNPMLVLHVTRHNIVTDTLAQLTRQAPADLKKPLKVAFESEEAVDGGGVRKEFFMLLLREILDPKYGMFKYYEESRLQWFNPMTFEDKQMFHLIGSLCGLAIYNSTIVQLSFPLALFKKLLNRKPIIDDLLELIPSVGRGLQEMLDYDADDVEDVFGLSFEITVESFGDTVTVPLVKGGKDKLVTKDNRQEYVDLYIDHILNKSVDEHFTEFSNGFHKVCGGKVLELFHPQELQAMVVGNENYDFHEMEKNTSYKGEYHRYHPTIQIFWDVFHDLSLEQKKKFLLFLTGSDRIPILGMQSLKIFIQPTEGGENYLPVAHTCFNLLDLPKYQDKKTMMDKLTMAIEQCEGFGIV